MNYKMIIFGVLSALIVVFILQNIAIVEIQFLFWSIQVSRLLLILSLLGIGFIFGWFVHGHVKKKKQL